jgi:hypothetical protein
MYSYEGYLKNANNNITFEEAGQLYKLFSEDMDYNDIDICEIWEELLKNIFKYMEYRCKWGIFSREERMEKDSIRTMNHDAVIDSFNQLSRFMKKKHPESSWREQLGEDRRRIGDFAMYIAYIYAINGR